jgi:cytochrome bd-type quinol oxidase subunit 1
MFLVVYTLLFALFLFLLDRKIKHGFEAESDELYHLSKGGVHGS